MRSCLSPLQRRVPLVPIADSTGCGRPATRKDRFPGAGGRGTPAGAKMQLGWEYKRRTVAHGARPPGNIPDNTSSDTGVA